MKLGLQAVQVECRLVWRSVDANQTIILTGGWKLLEQGTESQPVSVVCSGGLWASWSLPISLDTRFTRQQLMVIRVDALAF